MRDALTGKTESVAQFVLKLGHAVVVEHMERNSTKIILASACTLLILSFGYRGGFGLFVKPISDINRWGRKVIFLSLALQNLVWGVVAVVAGGLAGEARVEVLGLRAVSEDKHLAPGGGGGAGAFLRVGHSNQASQP